MHIKSVIIRNKSGLHARPAAEFVARAKKFRSDIQVRRFDEEHGINAKSMMRILSKCLSQGVEIEISAVGEDEVQAVEELVSLVETGFGEDR